jgi:hypothetical protein
VADPYLSGGATARRSSDPYLGGGGGSGGKKRKKKDGRSVGGAIGNLAGDAAGAITGLIPGLVETGDAVLDDIKDLVTPPRRGQKTEPFGDDIYERVLKPVGLTYKYTYGPLVTGDFGEFAKRVYEHPLGPMLDILTIASGGSAAAARLGLIEGTAARAIRLETASGGAVEKQVARSPIRGYGQLGLDALLKKLPSDKTPLGEFARAARVEKRGAKRRAVGNEYALTGMDRALRRVKDSDERVAAYLVATLPDPVSLDAYVARLAEVGSPEAAQTVAVIQKARPVYDRAINSYLTGTSSKQTQRVVGLRDEMAKISARDRSLKGSLLDPGVAEARPYLHMRLAEGGIDPDSSTGLTSYYHGTGSGGSPKLTTGEPDWDRRFFVSQDKAVAEHYANRHTDGVVREVQLHADAKLLKSDIDPTSYTPEKLAAFIKKAELDGYDAVEFGGGIGTVVLNENIVTKGGRTPSTTVPELKQRLAAQNLPEPVYTPDVPSLEQAPSIGSGGGGARQNLPSSLKQSKGTLFMLGRAIMDPAVVSTGYLRTVKFAHYTDLYNLAIDAGVWVDRGQRLPDGWERMPLPVRPIEATIDGQRVIVGRSSEKTSPLDATVTDFDEWARQNLGDKFQPGDPPTALQDAFRGATSDDHAVTGGIVRTADGQLLRDPNQILVLPTNYLRALRGEFTRSSKFIHLLNKYPMRVWRTMVLNLRPAWLVGNLVGSSMMFTVGQGGKGMRELGQGMLALTKSPAERAAFQKLMDETFPTQQHGTFIETQLPKYAPGSKGAKLQKGLTIATGGLAKIDQAFERSLRRASVRAELRKHPRLKETAKRMKADTAGFYQYVQKELDDSPALVSEIEDRINDSLGDFSNLSKFEKEYLRSVFPFYAWFRAITAVTLKLPVTYPGRTLLLTKIGQIGAELQDKSYPTSLQALVPIGDNNRVINTMPLNPFGTTIEIGRMLAALAAGEPGKAGEVVAGANPLVLGPLEFLFGQKLRNGAPVRGRGIAGSTLQSVYEGLPQVRLLESQGVNVPGFELATGPGTLYNRDARTELLNYILGGLSPKTINPKRARELAG